MVAKRTIIVGGIEVYVYSLDETSPTGEGEEVRKDVVIFFFLHGRNGSAEAIEPIARSMVEQCGAKGGERGRELLVVTFDQRNHGKRLVDHKANEGWSKDPQKNNERHAVDMYAIQVGSVKDVSFLIDFLPSFLYPTGKMPIVEWGVAGKSLGGHSAWIALATENRIKTGIPIIGCPDYLELMTRRATKRGQDVERCFPVSFKEALKDFDPACIYGQGRNPFVGKRVQVLSGKEDKLVPWSTSQEFVEEKLDVGAEGVKEVVIYEGIGHECCDQMVRDMSSFIVKYCL